MKLTLPSVYSFLGRFFVIILLSGKLADAKEPLMFDKKAFCIKERGNWRQFGDSCADSCNARFDIFTLCNKNLEFNCDCGTGSCWHENKCVSISAYKKLFEKKKKEREEEILKIEKKRKEKMEKDPSYSYYLHNLYPRPVETQDKKGSKKKSRKKKAGVGPGAHVTNAPSFAPPPQAIERERNFKIPDGYLKNQAQNSAPVNSNGQPQDLVFPVVPLP